ncbi:MAG: helix-turn-helix domain-containing protein [Burkholderiaceae bacterium]|jgi:putative transcriptional regulator|nr:helix-turn-helix domain-containing protein [Burkholderiaceae bacterium]
MKLSDLKNLDVQTTARAIEADAGQALPGIGQALSEVKAGVAGRVTTPSQILMRQARKATGLSQSEFARRIDTPVATLRDWEQGRFAPPGAATALARVISRHPQWADELVSA